MSTRHFFYPSLDADDTVIAPEIECEVDIVCDLDRGGEPEFTCIAVYVNGTNLMASHDPLARSIAVQIGAKAQENEDIQEAARLAEGIVYVGMGANDPDGHFEARREREFA